MILLCDTNFALGDTRPQNKFEWEPSDEQTLVLSSFSTVLEPPHHSVVVRGGRIAGFGNLVSPHTKLFQIIAFALNRRLLVAWSQSPGSM